MYCFLSGQEFRYTPSTSVKSGSARRKDLVGKCCAVGAGFSGGGVVDVGILFTCLIAVELRCLCLVYVVVFKSNLLDIEVVDWLLICAKQLVKALATLLPLWAGPIVVACMRRSSASPVSLVRQGCKAAILPPLSRPLFINSFAS